MRLRNLFENEGKVAAFALGRLNPATTGHELLVNAIKSQPGDHFLFLTDRAPKLPDNPLTSQEKLDWARKSFPDINVQLAQGISVAAHKLYEMGYRQITFLEGEDKLYKILVNYNGKTEGKKGPIEFPYNFKKINYVQLKRDSDASDATGMSGTKMRNYVINNDLKGFKKGVTEPAQPYAEEMFKKLQGLLGVDSVEEGVGAMAKGAVGHVKNAAVAGKLILKYDQTGREEDAFAAIKHGWQWIKNPKMRSMIVNLVKKFATKQGQDWPTAVAHIKKNTGIDVSNVNESNVVLDKTSLRQYIRDMITDHVNNEDDIKKLSTILYNLVGKQVKHRGQRYLVTDEDINEIMGFAIRRPKQHTVKRRPPEPEEDSVQDKIKKRRALASKIGTDKAFKTDSLKDK